MSRCTHSYELWDGLYGKGWKAPSTPSAMYTIFECVKCRYLLKTKLGKPQKCNEDEVREWRYIKERNKDENKY